jgi:hypothetical protein
VSIHMQIRELLAGRQLTMTACSRFVSGHQAVIRTAIHTPQGAQAQMPYVGMVSKGVRLNAEEVPDNVRHLFCSRCFSGHNAPVTAAS